MDHRYFRYFIAVAEELSFSRAAIKLHTVQPSLSQQIRRLEEIVGTPLFLREKHRVRLTEPGRIFLEEARVILKYTDQAIAMARQVARAEAGFMTVGFLPGVEGKIFPQVLPILMDKYPNIELSLRTLTSPQQMEALSNREINIGFMRPPIDDPEVVSVTILHEKILAFLPATHPLAKLRRVPIRQLASLPYLEVGRAGAPLLSDISRQIAEKAGVTFNSILPADNVLMSLAEVASGLGFCLMPDYACQIMPANVVAKPLDCDPEPEIPLVAAYHKDDHLPALAFFLSLLREKVNLSSKSSRGTAKPPR
jgi:LysR family hca operon transcriptional activator